MTSLGNVQSSPILRAINLSGFVLAMLMGLSLQLGQPTAGAGQASDEVGTTTLDRSEGGQGGGAVAYVVANPFELFGL